MKDPDISPPKAVKTAPWRLKHWSKWTAKDIQDHNRAQASMMPRLKLYE